MQPTSPTAPSLEIAFQSIAERYASGFLEDLPGLRTVGREAEFPIVSRTGQAVDARRLWNTLLSDQDLEPEFGAGGRGERDFIVGLKGPDFSYMLEVGLSTVEITTRPCQDLLEVEQIIGKATRQLVSAAARHDWRVLGYGIQPVTPPSLRILSPKERYVSLYRAMGSPLALVYGNGRRPASYCGQPGRNDVHVELRQPHHPDYRGLVRQFSRLCRWTQPLLQRPGRRHG